MKLKPVKTNVIFKKDGTKVVISWDEIDNYQVQTATYFYQNGDKWRNVNIYVKPYAPKYTPSIYMYNPIAPEDEKAHFQVQTTSYGSLPIAELDTFLKAMKRGREVALALTDYFLSDEGGAEK